MRVLTICAHPTPRSFCLAILDEFTKGLVKAGHTSEVVDLYAIQFDPVFGTKDFAFFADDSVRKGHRESVEVAARRASEKQKLIVRKLGMKLQKATSGPPRFGAGGVAEESESESSGRERNKRVDNSASR
jgi:putative NADPH-quinone reductase